MKTVIKERMQPKSIYVIDDAEWHNILLEKMLADRGYQVCTFTNGYSLLENLQEEVPNLVISDIDMPEMNGFELLEKIQNLPDGNEIQLIYLSSMNDAEVQKRTKENGAVGFIQKPLSKESFLDIVVQKL